MNIIEDLKDKVVGDIQEEVQGSDESVEEVSSDELFSFERTNSR